MLKDMDYVYAVYQEKSFSKAAKKLYISQPALSAAIKKVESNLNVLIFDRSRNPIQLTTAGKFYIKSIEKIMDIEKEMVMYFSAISKEKNSVINIGSSAFFCAHIVPSIVYEFNEQYPKCTVNILETNVEELINCLDTGVIDLSLGVESLETNRFKGEIWRKEHIVLAVPSHYGINEHLGEYMLNFETVHSKEYLNKEYPAVQINMFKDESFIFLRKGNDLHKRGMKMCHNSGFKPKVSMYLDQLLTSYYVAYSGKGIAFVRADIMNYVEPTEKLVFYKIDDESAVRDIMIHYKRSGELSDVAEDFLGFMKKYTY